MVTGSGKIVSKMGIEFEHWEVGFQKKMGWEMGLVPPFTLQKPLESTMLQSVIVSSSDKNKQKMDCRYKPLHIPFELFKSVITLQH